MGRRKPRSCEANNQKSWRTPAAGNAAQRQHQKAADPRSCGAGWDRRWGGSRSRYAEQNGSEIDEHEILNPKMLDSKKIEIQYLGLEIEKNASNGDLTLLWTGFCEKGEGGGGEGGEEVTERQV